MESMGNDYALDGYSGIQIAALCFLKYSKPVSFGKV